MAAGGRLAGVVVTVGLLLGACADGGAPTGATVPTPPTTTTTTPAQTIDITTIPDEITPEYLDAVFEALNAVIGDARRHAMEIDDIDRQVVDRYRAVYALDLYEVFVDELARQRSSGFEDFRDPLGDTIMTAVAIVHATRACIVVSVRTDTSEVFRDAGNPAELDLVLAPVEPGQDPERLNPTPWVVYLQTTLDEEEGIEACPDPSP